MAGEAPPEIRPRALVTGASGGIGAAVVRKLAAAGYDLAATATRRDRLVDTLRDATAAGARAVPIELDLRAHPEIERAAARAVDALGGIDLLVNNAGTTIRKPALEVRPEEWDAVLDVNLKGTFFLSQALARHFVAERRPGAIINIASAHGLVGFAGRSTYGISKAAIIHMTRMLAHEWSDHEIRVNAVAPATVGTPSRTAYFDADPEARAAMLRRVPMGRFCTPEEVAGAVAYLAGPDAGFITGQTLVLDGGVTSY